MFHKTKSFFFFFLCLNQDQFPFHKIYKRITTSSYKANNWPRVIVKPSKDISQILQMGEEEHLRLKKNSPMGNLLCVAVHRNKFRRTRSPVFQTFFHPPRLSSLVNLIPKLWYVLLMVRCYSSEGREAPTCSHSVSPPLELLNQS